MIREKRNKEKLTAYYNKFMDEGVVDPNVHPWVAESWQRCRTLHLPHETMPKVNRLTREQVIEHQKAHAQIVEYVDGLYEQNKQHFNSHNLSMLLIDDQGYVIKNYAMPFSSASSTTSRGCACWRATSGLPASASPGNTMFRS